ncbi:MAG: glycosyltransferase [Terriglobales bacterium]
MTAAPRIVWILDQLGMGGAERLALRFASAPHPWRIELIGLRAPAPGALAPPPGDQPVPEHERVHAIGMRGLDDLAGWWRLVRLLQGWQPVLIHTHLRYATVWGGTAARWLRRPYVTTVHLGPHRDTTLRQQVIAAGERYCRRHAARVIYVSAAQKRAWGAMCAHERAVVVGNGVKLPPPATPVRSALRRALEIPEAATVFTTVAVVRAAKGWRTWLAAVEQIARQRPQARFVWVGGGPEWESLRLASARSPAYRQIVLPGTCHNVASWLHASDVFLFPSQEEAQPTAVMEAMAAGLPVIATDLPSIVEVLDGCGLTVPVDDAAALAGAALVWSEPDHPAPRAAGAAARRRAESALSESFWCDQLSRLYEQVLHEPVSSQDSAG